MENVTVHLWNIVFVVNLVTAVSLQTLQRLLLGIHWGCWIQTHEIQTKKKKKKLTIYSNC